MMNVSKALHRWEVIILITASVKVLLFIFGIVVNAGKNLNPLSYWIQWDGPHYIDLAKNGYQTTGESALFIVFYPLYPILIWLFHFIANNFQIAAILVSVIFSFIASIVLFEVILLDFTRRTALLTVWFLNIFPTAYFLQASYTESLFLTLTLLTVYFFRKNNFLAGGIFGALTTMTRVNGILLLPLLFLETKKVGKNLLTFLLLPVGFLIYLLINYLKFGKPFYFLEPLYSNWFKKADLPWIGIRNLINSIPSYQNPDFYIYFSELVAIVFIVVMIFIVYFKVKKSYALFMFLNFLLFVSTNYILSTPRYTLHLFPIFIALALINNKYILTLISLISLVLLFYLTYLYTQGRWAF